jgi:serine/threonine protein kinase/tetratricopeptide (TPR) repeat protein
MHLMSSDSPPNDILLETSTTAEVRVATTSWEQVQEVCGVFCADREAGKPAAFSEYLNGFDNYGRETVIRNLLYLELQSRCDRGTRLKLEAVINELPQYESLIRNVFLESTLNFGLSFEKQGAASPKATSPQKTARLLGPYRIDRELGRGGMGAVFEACHLRTGEHVALKILPVVDPASLHRFKREFRSMAEINHPNLIGLHSLEQDGGHWFFTMDLIDGTDFLSYVRPSNRLNLQRLRVAFAQLVVAVLALHRHHIIHRDLKPSNVLVNTDGKVIVLDFGLVLESNQVNISRTEHAVGTPAYMAPEQAGGRPVTGAADWYSCGVMLYETLSGRRPFGGQSLMELILRKQDTDPEPLECGSETGTEIPDDLSQLAMCMLARAPQDRPDPAAIVQHVAHSLSGSEVISVESGSNFLVGRERQLEQLDHAWSRITDTGSPGIALVEGRSGEGKTALVDYFLKTASDRDHRCVIISGRCYDRESMPFKALDSLIDALTNYLRRLPDADAALLVPDDIDLLADLFPVLRRVECIQKVTQQPRPELDSQQVRKRSYAALRSLFGRLSRNALVIMFADDLQWGDADSAEAIADILLVPEAPPLFFIGSFRSDEVDSSAFLQKWKSLIEESSSEVGVHNVTVSPLTLEDSIQLTIATVGQDNDLIRRRAVEFYGHTGGNAFLMTELIGCFDPSSDSFEVIPINDLIGRRLAQLPGEAKLLLDAICVAGRSIQLAEATLAIHQACISVSLVTHMRSEKLVRFIGQDVDEVVDTYHDKIRETIMGEMAPERRMLLHGSLAKVAEGSSGGLSDLDLAHLEQGELKDSWLKNDRVFDLAYHFDAAGNSRRAGAYGYLAGLQASRKFSQQVAADYLALSRRNQSKMDQSVQFQIAYGEARARLLLGEYEQANNILEGLVQLASGAFEKSKVMGLQAEICHKQGRIKQGMELYSAALRSLGYWSPKSTFGAMVGLAYEVGVQILHSTLPKSFYQRAAPPDEQKLLAVELANRNSIVSYYSNTIVMLWTHLKGMNLSETRAVSAGTAYSYGLHPAPAAVVGLANRAMRYSEQAEKYAIEMNDRLTEGHSLAMRSMALFALGDYAGSVEHSLSANRLLTEVGDPYINFIADSHRVFSLARLMRTSESVECALIAFRRSIRLGEDASAGGNLLALTEATFGNFPYPELRECFLVADDDILTRCWMHYAEGMWHHHACRWDEAIKCFETSWPLAYRNWVIVPYSNLPLMWLITSLRKQAEESHNVATESRRLLRRANKLMRIAMLVSYFYPSLRAHALREHGLLLEHRGKKRRALKSLDRSLTVAKRQGDRLNHVVASLEYGRIKKSLGDPDATSMVEEAQHAIDTARNDIAEAIKQLGLT